MDNASVSAMHQGRHQGDEYRRIELITGTARRRRWTPEEKAAIVTESLQPEVNIAALARRWGVNRGLLQTWRRQAIGAGTNPATAFVPVRLAEDPLACEASAVSSSLLSAEAAGPASAQATCGTIEIESGGLRVRFVGPVDVGALHAVLACVGRRK
jgi:transposase